MLLENENLRKLILMPQIDGGFEGASASICLGSGDLIVRGEKTFQAGQTAALLPDAIAVEAISPQR